MGSVGCSGPVNEGAQPRAGRTLHRHPDRGHDKRVAFSCKPRGYCPSCRARRMSRTAAHLVDHVIPHVPVRQWVLSLPIPLACCWPRSPSRSRRRCRWCCVWSNQVPWRAGAQRPAAPAGGAAGTRGSRAGRRSRSCRRVRGRDGSVPAAPHPLGRAVKGCFSCDITRIQVSFRRSFTFDIDMQHCLNCVAAELKIIAVILELQVIGKILSHLVLDLRLPPRAGLALRAASVTTPASGLRPRVNPGAWLCEAAHDVSGRASRRLVWSGWMGETRETSDQAVVSGLRRAFEFPMLRFASVQSCPPRRAGVACQVPLPPSPFK